VSCGLGDSDVMALGEVTRSSSGAALPSPLQERAPRDQGDAFILNFTSNLVCQAEENRSPLFDRPPIAHHFDRKSAIHFIRHTVHIMLIGICGGWSNTFNQYPRKH
jgi:hypothetical protein